MERKVLIEKEFLLAGMPKPLFSLPLGWKLSCQARAFINDQLQVKEDFHEFIPCELIDESMMMREPNRDRPLIDVTEEYLKKFSDYEKHPSYSITALIEEIEDTINPIHK